MRLIIIFISLLFTGPCVIAQSNPLSTLFKSKAKPPSEDSVKIEVITAAHEHEEMNQSLDSLSLSDYILSIERVNDNLNAIADSARLGFEVANLAVRIRSMREDIMLIRQNVRGRNAVFNIKNQYLYQSFTARLDDENSRIQATIGEMFHRVYHAKQHLKDPMADSVFQKLYTDQKLQAEFDLKLVRFNRKWHRTDSTTKANVDTLNALKVILSDNSVNLSGMINILEARMDKSVPKLFGPEVRFLWAKDTVSTPLQVSTKTPATSIFEGEQKAVGYYISQTLRERIFVLILGIMLFSWLFFRRKLLETIRGHKKKYSYLKLQYLNNFPVLSLLVLLLCLMPFFDAYAPTSYISMVYLLLLTATTVIFYKKGDLAFLLNWLALVGLFIADLLIYLLIEPTFSERLLLLAVHAGIIVFTIRFYRSLAKQMSYYRFLRTAAIVGVILSGMGILFNLFGRFSLSGIVGMAGIFAVTQAVVLTVFVDTIVEVIIVQLQSSRLNKGIDKPFDVEIVVSKVKAPLIVAGVFIWLIMLASNLNIYHNIHSSITGILTDTRTVGSISFQLISVIMFIVIIWLSHMVQRLLSFYFGETGSVEDDVTAITKGHHSRLLITRLLVLVCGYLFAIAASGLPVDKLTFLLGAMGIGIGMGLQSIVNNFVSGIILIFDGSLQIGDQIETSGQAGRVKEIGLRASTLTTADGADVIIPNGNILSQNIVNWTFSNNEKRIMLTFSLSGNELDANIINEVINSTIKNIPNVMSERMPVILYNKVTPETCSLTIRFWSDIHNVELIKSQATLQLSAAFAAKEIGFE